MASAVRESSLERLACEEEIPALLIAGRWASLQGWCDRVEDVGFGGPEFDDGELAIGEDDIAGSVGCGFGDVRAIDERVGGGGSGEEEVGFDPLALAVDVGVDAMGPFGFETR